MSEKISEEFDALLNKAMQRHLQLYNQTPAWGASAPGRVNLIGDHTDYSGGFAMPFAIGRHTIALASPPEEDRDGFRVYSENSDETVSFVPGPPSKSNPLWHDYIKGVVSEFEAAGIKCNSADISIHSDVPVGSGLSSSASLEMAVATLIEAMTNTRLDPAKKIRLCQSAEHRYAHVPCGILDQFCVAMAKEGQLLQLDCESETAKSIPIAGSEVAFLVIDSAIRHQLNDGAYAQRRQQCELVAEQLQKSLRHASLDDIVELEEPVLQRRAQHVITENERVLALADAMIERNWQQAGLVMNDSHSSLSKDFEVSCADVDKLAAAAQEMNTVFGARMTGGGFGGCIIALVERKSALSTSKQITDRYKKETGLIAKSMLVQPVAGAREIKLDLAKQARHD